MHTLFDNWIELKVECDISFMLTNMKIKNIFYRKWFTGAYMYIYLYTHTYICVYIFIYACLNILYVYLSSCCIFIYINKYTWNYWKHWDKSRIGKILPVGQCPRASPLTQKLLISSCLFWTTHPYYLLVCPCLLLYLLLQWCNPQHQR